MGEFDTPIGTITPEHFLGPEGEYPRSCVLGPKFLYALYNPDDDFHSVSYAFLSFVRDESLPYRRFVVNEHVIDEAATRLKKRAGISESTAFLDALAECEFFAVVPLGMRRFDVYEPDFGSGTTTVRRLPTSRSASTCRIWDSSTS